MNNSPFLPTVVMETDSEDKGTGDVTYSILSRNTFQPHHTFSMDSASYNQYLADKRKGFRCRGSLGPTIASAPSVELEDYRTPKPSVSAIKNGKSFDLCAMEQHGSHASESNGLIKVSADFLRLHGSRQQFRNLLSARKKLGQLPPAYTQIDCSHESLDSTTGNKYNLLNQPYPQGPVITVENTGSNTLLKMNPFSGSTNSILNPESAMSSVEKNVYFENGNVNGGASNKYFKRNNSRYGVQVDKSHVQMLYKLRSDKLNTGVQVTDRCLLLAFIGIFFMVIETEICGQQIFNITKDHPASYLCRTLVLLSTVCLLFEIVHFHINDIYIDLLDCGADDWRVVVNTRRIIKFVIEFFICSICPYPGTGNIYWTFIEPQRYEDHKKFIKEVPIDVILSIMMLCRVYLIARFMVMHSKLFQDASTRTLAALNRIQVNFSFVMKTLLDQKPLLFLSIFTFCFWIIMAWTFAQVERYGRNESSEILYSNALWFIAITSMLNGYGDIVPKTNLGRVIAIFAGICGAIISSILIAVISKKILLSQGQRNVNIFMNDSRLTQEHKNSAARVLQHTWHIYKCLRSDGTDSQLRDHQRRFLNAIHNFRKVKNKMRLFSENCATSMQQMNRLMTEMHTNMQRLMNTQDEMKTQMDVMQRTMRNHFSNCQQQRQKAVNNSIGSSGGNQNLSNINNHSLTVGNNSPPIQQRVMFADFLEETCNENT
uniref:CaMBD domain-containing protein n=1 Tax=Strongyloides stercoralis TaxID=6248 RepID=A0A0K0E1I3_STRER